jgi:nucleotide-binding universal stress UspA family protein
MTGDRLPGPPLATKPVVVGYDGSGPAARAVGFAIEVAAALHSDLVIVHALEGASDVVEPVTEEERQSRQRIDEETLAELAREAGRRGVRASVTIREGPPVAAILETAARTRAGLVVVGNRGLRGAAKLLLGSVSSGVVAGSTVPVTVVR